MLDVVDMGFLVDTGKQLILWMRGAGTWWVGQHSGGWWAASAAQANPEEVGSFWSRHLHSDHVGGLTTQD